MRNLRSPKNTEKKNSRLFACLLNFGKLLVLLESFENVVTFVGLVLTTSAFQSLYGCVFTLLPSVTSY